MGYEGCAGRSGEDAVRVDHRPVTNYGARTKIGKVPGRQVPASHSSQRRASGLESGWERTSSLMADPGSYDKTGVDNNCSSNNNRL